MFALIWISKVAFSRSQENSPDETQGDEEMTAIEYAPIVQEYKEPKIDFESIVAETVEIDKDENEAILSENLAYCVGRVDSVIICSGQTAETAESLVTLSMNYRDCCDGGIPPIQQKEKARRRSSCNIKTQQSDDCEEFKQQISEKSKTHWRCCLTPRHSTFNICSNGVPTKLSTRRKKREDNALLTVISALYANLLVVMGLAFPMTEVISNHVPSFSYLGFYLYLYFGSIAYFFFVFFNMLKNRAAKGNRYFGCGSMRPSKILELKVMTDDYSEDSPPRIIENVGTQHYGSFYLRIGAVAFGVGSMIYSGLEFAQYFETDPTSECHNILMAATPAVRMAFTFIQMYFIFLNAKMSVYCKPRAIAYFGLMHIVATNLCVWLNVIIEETKHEIIHHFSHQGTEDHHGNQNSSSTTIPNSDVVPEHGSVVVESNALLSSLVDECKRSEMMGNVVQDASQFLFPCAIEYSLICAAILYVMWKNVSMSEDDGGIYSRSNSAGSATGRRSRHQYSVDCAKANKGLFAGIFVLVGIIISLIIFYALINNHNFKALAIMEVAVSRLLLFCCAFVATIVGIYRIRELKFDSSRHFGLDAVLLVVAQIGVMAYKFFTIIACCYSVKTEGEDNSTLVLLSALAAMFQAVAQTLFILDASRRHTYTVDQQSRKPGREVVTFLLVCNIAMWAVNTLEKSRADVNPVQLEFFGLWPWIIIMNVTMPLTIFYRFHSTVVLCEIWKRCYKVKPDLM
ncbi:proton channel OtopLc-like isoform X2 [Daphnia pulex]|uniref:proton channel OtopLc-like isoform X2 n=1 Tax=Daphnia pulex TaxID=6669 RepID=UPI001EDEE707|nr:proton channel OtopLc-like isoform X2 [Daphnia pulex]